MFRRNKPLRSPGQTTAIPVQPPMREAGSITDQISDTIFTGTPLWWWIGFLISGGLLTMFGVTVGYLLWFGVGIWDINIPVVWGFGIVNLVFWIGIGHAGTFISAVLLLLRQHWRSAFSRFAEAMTLFALAVAGLFPLLHLGRLQFAYWIFPYPNTLQLNPNWRSPLAWDAFAISVYGLVSLFFWYVDLVPDLAAMRDKTDNGFLKFFYGALSTGWRGDAEHWERLHNASYLFAAIATPLVISVHSVVGLDFAIANTIGWHHTIFPPYFVAGAVFSGFAMVVIVGAGLRRAYGLQDIITIDHMENAAKFILITGMMVGYGYFMEIFTAWYLMHEGEVAVTLERLNGPYAAFFYMMVFFNVLLIQALWFKRVRRSIPLLVLISIGVLIGMWLERFVIITMSLQFSHTAGAWEFFNAGFWDWMTLITPFGLFGTLLFLFIRVLPIIPIYEAEQLAAEESH